MKDRVLVLDDNEGIRNLLTLILGKNGYEVSAAENGKKGIDIMSRDGADIVVTDLHMPEMDGLQTLKEILKINPEAVVIMMTVDKSIKKAVEAMKEGAYDYIAKDGEDGIDPEEMMLVIERGLKEARLRQENVFLREELRKKADFSKIIGNSPEIKELFRTVKRIADIDSTVLISGESGTGKELIAQAIHYSGIRTAHPFVTINCSALPETLLESELFGHERGAFTGAADSKKGLFEIGDKGTVFMDEIGEMPLSIQSKVLRVLEEKEFRKVGGTKNIKVDARVVAATNRNLQQLIKEGKFREDLFYRLNVIPISLTPLRQKTGDIPLLIRHFIEKHNKLLHKKIRGIREEAVMVLEEYPWPGNVRELENLIERIITLIDEGKEFIAVEDLPSEFRAAENPRGVLDGGAAVPGPEGAIDFKALVGSYEKKIISAVLGRTRRKKEAAKMLGLNPRMLRYLVKKYGLGNEGKPG
ncbi:hypothetical protein COY52_07230 [Candidatus Desantisbacteria bacterium CG_4_10_14_0_8_um_filter_48_22]|uniref:Fis family transcriptional regulator n=1 Tax=Candidatus Desantisbacteria bacterium CG_4_10_14_0_8_um_filter_48_22 TaxID=1974543 RepID=A0A2M7SAS1_9BACT|nr:MAG: hypothetical protein AUJ67_04155 [Candidatus Desantisbacteria bacterium CG1_02_49_89]PIV54205.1 MAG: hypothetical protein COS16_11555 [Candidatus Desantisbacteria bacterium CG02_land_8_20_14_3_00_49_13]PIZ16373.1 MAG: hypothetical protein COY52_07230 [Candidatus Desantisbacteria bacterium CG_4_10_14_0_8_um_filter_48_22]PJB28199.1 MAG: hypothetical protein CO111_02210 [Candidatus Desantisbacteria bacterium CG_4_9_14_3_um_filter_50_7]